MYPCYMQYCRDGYPKTTYKRGKQKDKESYSKPLCPIECAPASGDLFSYVGKTAKGSPTQVNSSISDEGNKQNSSYDGQTSVACRSQHFCMDNAKQICCDKENGKNVERHSQVFFLFHILFLFLFFNSSHNPTTLISLYS